MIDAAQEDEAQTAPGNPETSMQAQFGGKNVRAL